MSNDPKDSKDPAEAPDHITDEQLEDVAGGKFTQLRQGINADTIYAGGQSKFRSFVGNDTINALKGNTFDGVSQKGFDRFKK